MGRADLNRVTTWRTSYARRVAVTDLIGLLVATVGAWAMRFGWSSGDTVQGAPWVGHATVAVVLALVWWLALAWTRSRDLAVLGRDAYEYRRVLQSTLIAFGLIGIASVMLAVSLSRLYLLYAFGLGLAALLGGRLLWRWQQRRQRRRGRWQSLVLVVGTVRSARRVARSFYADPFCGYRVVGVSVPDSPEDEESLLYRSADDPYPPIPVLGNTHGVGAALTGTGADTVIVTDSEQLGPEGLRDLGWDLEAAGIELLVSPNVVGVAQPRLHVQDVSGVPYIHVETPRYEQANGPAKVLFDRITSALLLVLLSPVLALIALGVRLSGPVLHRRAMVGSDGRTFTLLGFRTTGDDGTPTRLGAVLERYALDQLPELVNVLRGEMSIVGPRPLSPERHAELSEADSRRRLLVRQGMTGLWTSGGGTALSGEEMTRLDLEYVENWSLLRDLHVMVRAIRHLLSRLFVTRAVERLQAELVAVAPDTRVRLHVDTDGRVLLNDYLLFSGSLPTLLEEIEQLIAAERAALMVTTNVDQILDLERQAKTVEVYDTADLIVIDGMPVAQLARLLGADDVHRHTGADLLPLLADESAARTWRIAIMGGRPGIAEKAAETLRAERPGADIHAVEFPVLESMDDPASLTVIEELHRLRPQIVFVCLGAPKQELWYVRWREQLPPAVYIGAGAAVDFAAQVVTRAPELMQRVGAEWTWRLAQEPRRLARRYLGKGPAFLLVIRRSLRERARRR